MSLSSENIYEEAANQHPMASRVLAAQHRFFSALQQSEARDPRTGDLYPVALYRILAALEQVSEPAYPDVCDRFADIVAFAADAVLRVMKHPRSTVLRNIEMTPIHKASRLNAASIIWLNRQPGNTKKQKLLSCRHGIPAIQRHFSLDTGENRLLKKFVKDTFDILRAKESAYGSQLNEREENMLFKCNQWLREEEVQEIQHQRGTSINNAIMGDADYNRIWRASNRLAGLEEAILSDYDNLLPIETCQAFWSAVCMLKNNFGVDFPQQACHWDEEKLLLHAGSPDSRSISGLLGNKKISISWDAAEKKTGSIFVIINGKVIKNIRVSSFSPEDIMSELLSAFPRKGAPTPQMRQVCTGATLLDFCSSTPWYACTQSKQPIPLPFSLLQQYVSYLSPDNTQEYLPLNHTISTCALFEKGDIWLSIYRLLDPEYPDLHKDTYASYVASLLQKELTPAEDFVYLLPDGADEFSLRRFNAAMSQQFENALPLPTSVATVLGYAAKNKCSSGTVVFVIEKHSDGITITPMEAEKPSKVVYVPGGVVWVRHPAHILPLSNQQTDKPRGLTSLRSPEATKWLGDMLGVIPAGYPEDELQNKLMELRKLPVFDSKKDFRTVEIGASEMLMQGAGIYRDFTLKTRDIKQATIWRHHLPPLFAQFEDNNYLIHDLPLVDYKTTINPRDQHFHIPIADTFVLKAGRKNYSFPLKKGTGADSSKYEIYLHSPMFPLTEDETCSLELFYTYGAAEPYEMYFVSSDSSWRVKVEWRKFRANQVPGQVPDTPGLWPLEKFGVFTDRSGNKIPRLQLLLEEWKRICNNLSATDFDDYLEKNGWVACEINKIISLNNGERRIFLHDDDGNRYYCLGSRYQQQKNVNQLPAIEEGNEIYVLPGAYDANHKNYRVRRMETIEKLQAMHQRSLNVTINIRQLWILEKLWNSGRCCGNGIPDELANTLAELSPHTKTCLHLLGEPEERTMALGYFLRMGVDAPKYAVRYLKEVVMPVLEQSSNYTKAERRVFLAIGDGQCDWQKELFRILMSTFTRSKDREPHRFWILARVLWRDPGIIGLLDYDSLCHIVNNLCKFMRLGKSVYVQEERGQDVYVDPRYASAMEIMLALLRLRGRDDVKLQKALSLNSPLVNQMYECFQKLLRKLSDENAYNKMHSRLEISLPESVAKEITVPPLIYLLRCYLTGVHTPAGITVEEISDDEL